MRKQICTGDRFIALTVAGVLWLSVSGIPTFAERAVDGSQDAPQIVGLSADVEGEQEDSFEALDASNPPDGEAGDYPISDEPNAEDGGGNQEGLNSILGAAESPSPTAQPAQLETGFAIVAFEALSGDVAQQKVAAGTALADLILPDTLAAVVEDANGDRTGADIHVERWDAVPAYDAFEMGNYLFTPVLAAAYTLEDSAAPPEIAVGVVSGADPAAVQQTISSYAELSAQLTGYAGATEDVEILLEPNFPVDMMTGVFVVPGNTGGHTLTIRSAYHGSPVVLTRESAALGHLFVVSNGAHLILQEVVLDGGKIGGIEATGSLVNINGGTLTLQAGAVLRNNNDTSRWGSGGGVSVYNGGTFIMEDGLIADNMVADRGGGVFVSSTNKTTSTFTMEGGGIRGNTAHGEGGGGVHVNVTFTDCFGAFTLKDGIISGNKTTNKSNGHGGGVYVGGANTSIAMEGGEISGNTAEGLGGGVYVSSTLFTMKDGLVADNQTTYHGGGVSVGGYGSFFSMEYGVITGNTADGLGGGVYSSNSGGFLMGNGLISGNDANNGGGIATSNSLFTLQGGQIINNIAKLNGGGISGTGINGFVMEDGIISGNAAHQHGGGLYFGNKSATVQGGSITGNSAKIQGGGFFADRSSTLTLEGGIIAENTAENGGGVYTYNNSGFTMADGLILLNTADEGNGVFAADTAGSFTITGGLIFGRGRGETSVVRPAAWEPDNIGEGIVIRWSGDDGSVYLFGDDEHLYPMPISGTQAVWEIDADRHGVAYTRGKNTGFVELPVTVRYPAEITISGIFRYDETLFAPTSLPAPPTGGWGALAYQWTRDGVAIPGATGSTYVQAVEDIGKVLNVTVTAQHGYAPSSSGNTVPTAKALQPAPPPFVLDYTYNRHTHRYTVTIPETHGGEYSFDGGTYHAARTTMSNPGDVVTGFKRYAETATHEVGPATASAAPLPIMVISIAVTGEGGRSHITTKGATLQMLANVQPPGANQRVTWTVSGTAGMIDSAGLLTALSNGSVTVRATATDGSEVYGEMTVIISGQSGGGIPGPAAYTVSYDANGGQGRVPAPVTVRQGTPYTIMEPALVKPDGQRFKVWNTHMGGDGAEYKPGETITMPGHSLILYAMWEEVPLEHSHIVTFDPNGGAVFPEILQTGEDGRLAYLPTPTRSGSYVFVGWYTAGGSGVQVTADHVFETDTTLYARWRYTGPPGSGGDGDTDVPDTHVPTIDTPGASTARPAPDRLSVIVHVNEVFTLPSGVDVQSGSSGWSWDADYLSAAFGPTVTFTALREGTTTVIYTGTAGNRGQITVIILPTQEILTDIPHTGRSTKGNPNMGAIPFAHGFG